METLEATAEQIRYVIMRMSDYVYYQKDGSWGNKATAEKLLYLDACYVRDELEEALGVNCSVVMA